MIQTLIILNVALLGAFVAYFLCVHTGKLQGTKGDKGEKGEKGDPGRCCANCNEGYSGQCYVWKPKIIEAVPIPPCEVGEMVPQLPGEAPQELPDSTMFKGMPSPEELRARIAAGEKPEDIMASFQKKVDMTDIPPEGMPGEDFGRGLAGLPGDPAGHEGPEGPTGQPGITGEPPAEEKKSS